jgi:hypothetical protein
MFSTLCCAPIYNNNNNTSFGCLPTHQSSFQTKLPDNLRSANQESTVFENFIFLFQGWKLYDSGPKSVKVPLVCLPPVSGTADVFFKQILALSAKGIRVIAVRKCYTTLILTCPSIFYVAGRLFTFSIVQKV